MTSVSSGGARLAGHPLGRHLHGRTLAAREVIAALRRPGARVYHEVIGCAEYGGTSENIVVSDAAVLQREGMRACRKCWSGRGYRA